MVGKGGEDTEGQNGCDHDQEYPYPRPGGNRTPAGGHERQANSRSQRRQVEQFTNYALAALPDLRHEFDKLGQVQTDEDQGSCLVINPRSPVADQSQDNSQHRQPK